MATHALQGLQTWRGRASPQLLSLKRELSLILSGVKDSSRNLGSPLIEVGVSTSSPGPYDPPTVWSIENPKTSVLIVDDAPFLLHRRSALNLFHYSGLGEVFPGRGRGGVNPFHFEGLEGN